MKPAKLITVHTQAMIEAKRRPKRSDKGPAIVPIIPPTPTAELTDKTAAMLPLTPQSSANYGLYWAEMDMIMPHMKKVVYTATAVGK